MGFTWTLSAIPMRGGHLLVVIPLVMLLYPRQRRDGQGLPSALDWLLALAAIATFSWAIMNAERYEGRYAGFDEIPLVDLVFGIVAVAVILEATRRTLGMTVVWLTLVFIAYALTGPLWPGMFEHKGRTFTRLVEYLYLTDEGIFNIIVGIVVTYLFTFLMFGTFLQVSGGERIFSDIAHAVAGSRRGGAAKVAVISSGMFGMLSGATVSNVVMTGTFTIPLMKRTGFKPHEAAAIETVASVGGALTPPLMGAGVFVMAAFSGVPVNQILLYSIVPAVLYFISLYAYVDIKARKHALPGLPRESVPHLGRVLLRGGHIFLPLFVLIYLLADGYTPFLASSASVILVAVVGLLRPETRMSFRGLLLALEASTRVVLTITPLMACAGILYAVISLTGLLVKSTSIIIALADGSSVIAIVLIGVMSYVIGMGLPVTASYVLLAALGAPALAELGIPILAAHLIIFWFSQDSTITPPVCLTAQIAARIAGAPPMLTGWHSVLMAKPLYIIPFVFAYGDLLSTSLAELAFDAVVLACGLMLMPAAFEGYLREPLWKHQRVLVGASALAFIAATFGSALDGALTGLIAALLFAAAVASARFVAAPPPSSRRR
jgi:TRAP transporter 4TM/12TM fusion protein